MSWLIPHESLGWGGCDEESRAPLTDGQPHWTPTMLHQGPKALLLASSQFLPCVLAVLLPALLGLPWQLVWQWSSVGVCRREGPSTLGRRCCALTLGFCLPLGSCCCWGDRELGKQTAPCERSRMLIGGNMLTVMVIFQSLAWRGAVFTWLFSSNFSIHPWAEKFRALDVISSLPAFYFLLWGGGLGRKWSFLILPNIWINGSFIFSQLPSQLWRNCPLSQSTQSASGLFCPLGWGSVFLGNAGRFSLKGVWLGR